MSQEDKEAPIFIDAFELSKWLLERMQNSPHPLAGAISQGAICLVEDIALALGGHDKFEKQIEVDQLLVCLRMRIRLSVYLGLLNERQCLFAAEKLTVIGNQLGAWMRKSRNHLDHKNKVRNRYD